MSYGAYTYLSLGPVLCGLVFYRRAALGPEGRNCSRTRCIQREPAKQCRFSAESSSITGPRAIHAKLVTSCCRKLLQDFFENLEPILATSISLEACFWILCLLLTLKTCSGSEDRTLSHRVEFCIYQVSTIPSLGRLLKMGLPGAIEIGGLNRMP